jgi:hypothetical protein
MKKKAKSRTKNEFRVELQIARTALIKIYSQATRRKRASDLKTYLETDLEMIEGYAERAIGFDPELME